MKINLLGNIENKHLLKFYRSNSVDLFINSSEKEGTPVSIMEAMSFGIPIMATAFGGNKEIIDKGAGIMLSIDPTMEEISDKMAKFLFNDENQKFRKSSYDVWSKDYNSDLNYNEFRQKLESYFIS